MCMIIKRKAFTLIELLVVIAIIALLLSILMPALNRVKEQSRTVVCQTHIKQLYLANMLYAENFDGSCVDAVWNINEDFLRLLLDNKKVEESMNPEDGTLPEPFWWAPFDEKLICPSSIVARKGLRPNPGCPLYPSFPECFGATYAYNLGGTRIGKWKQVDVNWIYCFSWKLTEIKNPGQKVMFIDSSDLILNNAENSKTYTKPNSGINYELHWDIFKRDYFCFHQNEDGVVSYRHNEAASILFYDGHTERRPKEDVWREVNGSSDNGFMGELWKF